MAKVKTSKYSIGTEKPKSATKTNNNVRDFTDEEIDSVTSTAPVKIETEKVKRSAARTKLRSYSVTNDDIHDIDELLLNVRRAGLFERSKSDIIRAGIAALKEMETESITKLLNDKVEYLNAR